MQKKQILSKKYQKKIKKQEKLLQVSQEKAQIKEKNTQKQPADKNSSEEQPQQNGDIDFNQLEQIQEDGEKIDVTFLIAQIREEYYHSMKTVFLRYGQIILLTESQIASQVLQKGNIGNVVVAEDDEEDCSNQDQEQSQLQQQNDQLNVYSVVTLVPSSTKITQKVKKQAKSSLEKNKSNLLKAYSKAVNILNTPKSCSLLVSARLPNLPSFIVCNSHQVFVSDLQQVQKKTPKNAIFESEYVLNVSEVEITNQSTSSLDDLIFSKFEDYQFCQKSLYWWVGQNIKSQRQKADLRRLYFIISLKDYYDAVGNIKNYLQQN